MAAGGLTVLSLEDGPAWTNLLRSAAQHDFYLLPAYHALAEARGEGRPQLYFFTEGDDFLALPLLLREIDAVPGLEGIGDGWRDATSIYGYAGPIASRPDLTQSTIEGFQEALKQALLDQRVVAVFSRLHPLIPWQSVALSGLGECLPAGHTVSIDLTQPVKVQRSRYRKDHKYGVNKLRRLGVTALHDRELRFLDDFVRIYQETMDRVAAADDMYFDADYFRHLVTTPELGMRLFVCQLQRHAICAGLFAACGGIVQYHLSGTLNEYMRLAPMKLLIDTVRLWATENGYHTFHLGGGVGGEEDSLFEFKAGFSDRRHLFRTWRWVVSPEAYESLCRARAGWRAWNGPRLQSAGFFPAYRSP